MKYSDSHLMDIVYKEDPKPRTIDGKLSPIQPTFFGMMLDMRLITSISDIWHESEEMGWYEPVVGITIRLAAPLVHGAEDSCISRCWVIRMKHMKMSEFTTIKETQPYRQYCRLHQCTLEKESYVTFYDITEARELLQKKIDYLIDLWEKVKVENIPYVI